jgi:hypothetical protein
MFTTLRLSRCKVSSYSQSMRGQDLRILLTATSFRRLLKLRSARVANPSRSSFFNPADLSLSSIKEAATATSTADDKFFLGTGQLMQHAMDTGRWQVVTSHAYLLTHTPLLLARNTYVYAIINCTWLCHFLTCVIDAHTEYAGVRPT